MPSIAALRHAPWSPSKIQCAHRCPLEFHYRYVAKIHEPEVAPDTRLGKALHQALEAVLRRTPVSEALAACRQERLSDEERARFDELGAAVAQFTVRIAAFRARRRIQVELIEHRLAVGFDLAPTEFLARDAFFRGVWDAAYLFDDGMLAIVDHKTGIRRGIADHTEQLRGYATLALANLGQVKRVWLGIHYVAAAVMEWTHPVDRATVFAEHAPGLVADIEAAALAVAVGAVPKMSTWCRRCSYKSICPAMRASNGELPEVQTELVDDALKDG